jgi:uncharacterized protein
MLHVETYLAESPIDGIGLFAKRPIRRNALIWQFAPGFDLELSDEELKRLADPCRRRILEYAYYNAQKMRYILCSDDARFINHSPEPNTHSVGFGTDDKEEGVTLAARDIEADEEITEDYAAFEERERLLRFVALPRGFF